MKLIYFNSEQLKISERQLQNSEQFQNNYVSSTMLITIKRTITTKNFKSKKQIKHHLSPFYFVDSAVGERLSGHSIKQYTFVVCRGDISEKSRIINYYYC